MWRAWGVRGVRADHLLLQQAACDRLHCALQAMGTAEVAGNDAVPGERNGKYSYYVHLLEEQLTKKHRRDIDLGTVLGITIMHKNLHRIKARGRPKDVWTCWWIPIWRSSPRGRSWPAVGGMPAGHNVRRSGRPPRRSGSPPPPPYSTNTPTADTASQCSGLINFGGSLWFIQSPGSDQ